MRVFVTGISGFLGRAFRREAIRRGHALLALVRPGSVDPGGDAEVAVGDLASVPWPAIERFAPEALLHLAWVATPGEYLDSPRNATLAEQSVGLIEGLSARGVSRMVATGTCIEYAASDEPHDEHASALGPDTPYAAAKARVHAWLAERAWPAGSSWTWARVFHPYGPGEHPQRITSLFLEALAADRPVLLRTPASVKDFVFVDDVARALCDLLESDVVGPVNVGTGEGHAIREVALACARTLGADPTLVRDATPPAADPHPRLVARADRLRSTGWRPRVTLDEGVARLARSRKSTTA